MGEWCAKNLKDIQGWKEDGLNTTIVNNDTAKLLDGAIRQLVSLRDCDQLGGLVKTVTDMLHNEPTAVLPRIFSLVLDVLGTNKSWYKNPVFQEKIKQAVKDTESYGNEREKLHAKALSQLAIGFTTNALYIYESILAQYPNDLMALKFSHQLYFFSGKAYLMSESVNRIVRKWSKDNIMYSYVLGMQAFGYEETGNYKTAEKVAEEALTLRKEDCWATHALSHVYEMTGQFEKGIEKLEQTASYWRPCWILECHNLWHLALFYIETGRYENAMKIYDENIKSCIEKNNSILDACDASGLLQRLEFRGYSVGQKRWDDLIPFIVPYSKGHMYPFNYPLMAIAFAHSSDDKLIRNFVDVDIVQNIPTCGDTSFNISQLSIPLVKSIDDYFKGNYSTCLDRIYPLRYSLYNVGGSNAQRDIFSQTMITAGLHSKNIWDIKRAKIVLDERRQLFHWDDKEFTNILNSKMIV
uniref:Tetratricopeptide repeat protein 38 n=1 Tax=Parastrongyloides trichosuri TaxID=131310 RepID=A0A0N4Z3B1_PARTI